jgi:hypothetical protein
MGSNEKPPRAPSADEFARQMLDAIRDAGETGDLRYERAEFRIVVRGGANHSLNLHNAYREYGAATQSNRPGVVASYVRSWFASQAEVPASFEEVRGRLLPTIRARTFYELARLRVQTGEDHAVEFPYRPVGEHFGMGVVFDMPDGMILIQGHHIADWNVPFEEAAASALENLRPMSRERFQRRGERVWAAPWHDNYAPSRLLLPERIRQVEVRGDPVATIPHRDALFVTGSEDEAGLGLLASLTEDALRHPRPLSGVALRLAGETWVPFLPGRDHPHHREFQRLAVKALSRDYGEQKPLLDALHLKTGKDIFVAGYIVTEHRETKELRSYCAWSEGVDSLLPRADVVQFVAVGEGQGEVLGGGPWERVRAVMGEAMERLDIYPERYRVRSFPSQEQLAEIMQG